MDRAEAEKEATGIGAIATDGSCALRKSPILFSELLLALVAFLGTFSAASALWNAAIEHGPSLSLVVTIDRILLS